MNRVIPTEDKSALRNAVVAAVQLPHVTDAEFEASLTELRELAKTLGYRVLKTFVQNRNAFDINGYFGSGKREEISAWINADTGEDDAVPNAAAETHPVIDALLIDHEISPSQARNLEKQVGCDVMDRTMVILEIFHRNARTPAAQAQVEIARLGYMAPRLREAAKLAGPQGRQRSGTGGRGAGESHTELDRRKIRDRIAELQREIAQMESERKTQRARRQIRQGGQGLAVVALVGYTNAGKSTLMRALTGSEVLVANKLFATLDTTVRTLHPDSVPSVLVSDTVGFIKNLPHDLVASFKSTLEEALDASLLLHVVDASDPGFERQLEVTQKVIGEIGADEVPKLLVFNKIDFCGDAEAQQARREFLQATYPECFIMSALNTADVALVRQKIVDFFKTQLAEAELYVPWSAQKARGEIFSQCRVQDERSDEHGTFFTVLAEPALIEELQARFPQPAR